MTLTRILSKKVRRVSLAFFTSLDFLVVGLSDRGTGFEVLSDKPRRHSRIGGTITALTIIPGLSTLVLKAPKLGMAVLSMPVLACCKPELSMPVPSTYPTPGA
jgi:hypothetical protein